VAALFANQSASSSLKLVQTDPALVVRLPHTDKRFGQETNSSHCAIILLKIHLYMYRFLCSLALLGIFVAGCNKDAPETCITVPAAQGIVFRLVDNKNGGDLLKGGRAGITVDQPCRTVPLVSDYKMYPITGTNDSATILSFGNLATPEYGTGLAECYRILFTFPDGDQDTVDWHYRIDQSGDCKRQTIDYMTYNGQNAIQETSFGRTYYRLTKK